MMDIGCVFYRMGNMPGTMTANWSHPLLGSGTGVAQGGPSEGFPGRYQIQYFDELGNEIARRELMIEQVESWLELTWLLDDQIRAKGIGIETPEGLAAGWYDVEA
jgi:hypothetical protein